MLCMESLATVLGGMPPVLDLIHVENSAEQISEIQNFNQLRIWFAFCILCFGLTLWGEYNSIMLNPPHRLISLLKIWANFEQKLFYTSTQLISNPGQLLSATFATIPEFNIATNNKCRIQHCNNSINTKQKTQKKQNGALIINWIYHEES